ncbi:hypothetical protein PNI0009_01344 [Streptococcus pneumoniae PNI0009]|nr:hypothetical protein PNI0010_02163 [Streptococcus pneumoniae PNI0010]ELU79925.1 hypothetical protein PNI0009_01344 [Streptococcus pneumoniae PNI0009]
MVLCKFHFKFTNSISLFLKYLKGFLNLFSGYFILISFFLESMVLFL